VLWALNFKKSMSSKQTNQLKAAIFTVSLLFCQYLFAQTESLPILPQQDSTHLKKYNLFDDLSGTLIREPGESWLFGAESPALQNSLPEFDFNKKNRLKTFSFSQNKFESVLPELGSVEYFHNQFRWKVHEKMTVDFGAGIVMQNTIMNSDILNYQLSFSAVLEYSFNDWLSAYFYGQYLTRPLTQPPDYFDPFIHNNPLFMQSEFGTGLKAKYKNKYIDFRIFSIYGSEYNGVKPVHSKIRIGF